MNYKAVCKRCGMKPYSIEKEERLPDNIKVVRQCKIDLVSMCDQIRKAVDVVEAMTQEGPELDDQEYVHAITEFRQKVRMIRDSIGEIIVKENKQ